jgi:hypothetical protein
MEWIGSLVARVKRLGSSTPDVRKLLADRGIGFVSLYDEDPDFAETKRRVDALVASGKLEHFPALFRHAFETGRHLTNGWPVYALQRRYFYDATGIVEYDIDKTSAALPAYEAAYKRLPNAETAALLAYAHERLAYAYRGDGALGGAGEVQGDPEGMTRHLGLAFEVMRSHADEGATSLMWRRQHYRLGVDEDLDLTAFQARFDAIHADMPTDIGLIQAHARTLLPRWMGGNAQDMEHFARRVMQATERTHGRGAYALVYASNTSVSDHDPPDTAVDRALLMQAFGDLAERFPAPSIINTWLDTMLWFEDAEGDAQARALLDKRLSAIVPECWSGDTWDEQVEDALDAIAEVLLSDD